MTEGAELPASWQVGDAALPTSLEERKAFLGLDDLLMDKKRGSHMGEPKVEQHQNFQSAFCLLINFNITKAQVLDTICLFNHVLRDFGGPRDQSHSSIGRKETHRNSAQAM